MDERDATGARALFFLGPRSVAIRPIELLPPRAGELAAVGLASAVSQGTEMLLYRGEGPEPFDPSLGKAGQTYPCRYGYAWVGAIAATGQHVFALATHADRHVLREDAVRYLPDHLPATRATLAANLETAVTCTWDAEAAFGDRVTVLGGGVVGTLIAWLLARSGAHVTLIEPREGRRKAAATLLETAIRAPRQKAAAILGTGTPDGRSDVVVEATGSPDTLDGAIAWAAPDARIVIASFYGRRRAAIDLGDAFHRRRLALVASQVSNLPPRLRPRWDATRRFSLVTELLEEPALDALIGPPVRFDEAPDLYAALERDCDGPPCSVFVYR